MKRAACAALGAAIALLPAGAAADPVPGSVYKGTVSPGGGTVTLTVSGDGGTVNADFSNLSNPATSCSGVGFGTGAVPLTGDSFNYLSDDGLRSANGTFAPSAVSGAAQVLTTPCTTGSKSWQVVGPDMAIEKPKEVGFDVFSPTGAAQGITLKARRGESPSVLALAINAGLEPDSFLIEGCDSAKGIKVSYEVGKDEDITEAVLEGSYDTGALTPTSAAYFTAELKVTKRAKVGESFSCKVTADSGLLVDTIKAKLEIKRGKPSPE